MSSLQALPAEQVVFQPLNQTREFNAHEVELIVNAEA